MTSLRFCGLKNGRFLDYFFVLRVGKEINKSICCNFYNVSQIGGILLTDMFTFEVPRFVFSPPVWLL